MLIVIFSRHGLTKKHIASLQRIYGKNITLKYFKQRISVEQAIDIIHMLKPGAVVFYAPLSIVYRIFLAMKQGILENVDILLSVDRVVPVNEAEWTVKRSDGTLKGFRHDHFIILKQYTIVGYNPLTGEHEEFIPP